MAKPKGTQGVQSRHLYNRASYLYQAATYFSNLEQSSRYTNKMHSALPCSLHEHKAVQNLSRRMVSDLRSVALKAMIRQSTDIKSTMCKFCDTLQVEGQTCTSIVENQSKGGRKPWADVLVTRCTTCGHAKRFPVTAPRQKGRPLREQQLAPSEQTQMGEMQLDGGEDQATPTTLLTT